MSVQPVEQAEQPLSSRVAHIAGVLASTQFPTGDRAALRRMSLDQPIPLTFYRFAFRHLPDGWERRLRDWVTLVAGMALMSPHIHRQDVGLGKALAQAGFSEARLERLLAAQGDTRRILLLRVARYAAAKGTAFNWTDGAHLLLITDSANREQLHLRIARDFYQNL